MAVVPPVVFDISQYYGIEIFKIESLEDLEEIENIENIQENYSDVIPEEEELDDNVDVYIVGSELAGYYKILSNPGQNGKILLNSDMKKFMKKVFPKQFKMLKEGDIIKLGEGYRNDGLFIVTSSSNKKEDKKVKNKEEVEKDEDEVEIEDDEEVDKEEDEEEIEDDEEDKDEEEDYDDDDDDDDEEDDKLISELCVEDGLHDSGLPPKVLRKYYPNWEEYEFYGRYESFRE